MFGPFEPGRARTEGLQAEAGVREGAWNGEPGLVPVPRGAMGLALGLGGLVGGVLAALVTLSLSRDGSASAAGGLVVAGSTLATLWPVAMFRRVRLRTVAAGALGISVARTLLVLAIGLGVDLAMELPRQGFWLGVLAGAVAVLVIETAAVLLLVRTMFDRGVAHA